MQRGVRVHKQNSDSRKIIKNWPTSGQLVGSQVPTELAYSEDDTTNFSWGYDISPRAKKVCSSNLPFPYLLPQAYLIWINR